MIQMQYTIDKNYIDDDGTWENCHENDLWIFDKLLVAKKLGYICGPHGVKVPQKNTYIVRPCVNLMSMGRGAEFKELEGYTNDKMPDGFFWCEVFKGRHLSVDYEDGKQILCVEGFRNENDPIWKWNKWVRTVDNIEFPEILQNLYGKYRYSNVELIDGNIIEVHLRLNSNWIEMDYQNTSEMIPVFNDNKLVDVSGYSYKESPCFLRKGFYFK